MLLAAVLITYGSLYPWQRRAVELQGNPFWILIHSWPFSAASSAIDIVVNILLYAPLGFLGFLTFSRRLRAGAACLASCTIGFVLSASIEMLQLGVAQHVTSAIDLSSNTLGTVLGAVAGWLLVARERSTSVRHDIAILLCSWIVYQTFPWVPGLSFHLRGGLGRAAAAEVFLRCCEALGLAALSERFAPRHRRLLFMGLLLLAPCRMLISGRSVTVAEMAGVGLGFGLWLLLGPSLRTICGLTALAVILQGLAPFRFETVSQPFSWIPFAATLSTDWQQAVPILVEKAFRYGLLIWLLRECGVRLAKAGATVCAVLACIEIAQTMLPGRTAEITDPLLALIIAYVLWTAYEESSLECNNVPSRSRL